MNEREKKELLEWYGRYAGVTVRSDMEEEFVYDAYRVLLKHIPDIHAPLERTSVSKYTGAGLLYFLGLPQGDVLRYYGGVSEEEMWKSLDAGKALLTELDAYGHLSYTVGYGDEGDDRGDWLAAADFVIGTVAGHRVVAYHVVVNSESGGFIDTTETHIVPVKEAPYGLLETYRDIGYSMFDAVTEAEDEENARMCTKFDADLHKDLNTTREK
jgi:hypothetical protein